MTRPLGGGTFGTVYETTRLPDQTNPNVAEPGLWTGTTYRSDDGVGGPNPVVKIFTDGGHYTTIREMSLLSKVCHPFVVRCLGWTVAPTSRAEVYLERAQCDVEQLLSHRPLHPPERRRLCAHVLAALVHLHEQHGTMHRDVKPENILFFPPDVFKLSDLGLATMGRAEDATNTGGVTSLWFRAPEVAVGCDYDKRIDVWSLGAVLLYTILASRVGSNTARSIFPLRAEDNESQFRAAIGLAGPPWERHSGGHLAAQYAALTSEVDREEWAFLQRALAWPDRRATALELLGDPYLAPTHHHLPDKPLLTNPRDPPQILREHLVQGPLSARATRAIAWFQLILRRFRWSAGIQLPHKKKIALTRVLECVFCSPGAFHGGGQAHRELVVAVFNLGVKLFCVCALSEKRITTLLEENGLGYHRPPRSKAVRRLTSWLCAFTKFRLDLFEPPPLFF